MIRKLIQQAPRRADRLTVMSLGAPSATLMTTLAGCPGKKVILRVDEDIITKRKNLDTLESRYPHLGGTVASASLTSTST